MITRHNMALAAIITLTSICGANALYGKQKDRRSVREEHIYKTVGERPLSLYIVKPDNWKEADSRPAIVFFHGGGWAGGKPVQFNEHSKYFASRGLVCIQVQYRLIDRKKLEPPKVCIQDAKSAMRWIRGNAAKLGIDPVRIASAGGSAGGHLAAFVGMVEGMDDPSDDLTISAKSNAMLLFNPVLDNGPGGYGHKRVGEAYKKYSPFHNVSKDDPPAVFFLGTKDWTIPVKTAYDFEDTMNEVGVECYTFIFSEIKHGFFNYGGFDNLPYYKTILECDQFLVSRGWLQGDCTLEISDEQRAKIEGMMIKKVSSKD